MDDQNKIKRNKHFKTIRSSCLLCGDKALSHCYSTEMGNYKHIMALCSQCKLIQAVETDWPAVTELPTHLVEYHYKKPNESIQVFGCNCNDASLKNHKKKYSKYIS
ncbi:hypothetical protein KJ708_09705, partial [bacterium]|nr:hypothetical protein [bacterium]MBU1917406.1 hypothetical protein [bacterium]